jgi:signal transduction histidine kinase
MLDESKLGKLTAEQLDMVATIRRQAQTLGQMVEGLTQVAAFLSKQETVKPRLAQLNPVLENVVLLAEFKARSKGITLETEITPDLPTLHLDAKQLEEALNQLVDNAIKFNQAGGAIKISVAPDHQGVKIAVSDTGTGIEAEDINRIWEIFEQGIDPIRRAQEGLGLGLVLARYIVEAHRGTIRVETKRGKGSTFTVRLPKRRATTGRLGK